MMLFSKKKDEAAETTPPPSATVPLPSQGEAEMVGEAETEEVAQIEETSQDEVPIEELVRNSFSELKDIAPTLTVAGLLSRQDFHTLGDRLRRGYSLRDAYLLCEMAATSRDSRGHLTRTPVMGGSDAGIPPEIERVYGIFMPKASRAEIARNYSEYLAKTGK